MIRRACSLTFRPMFWSTILLSLGPVATTTADASAQRGGLRPVARPPVARPPTPRSVSLRALRPTPTNLPPGVHSRFRPLPAQSRPRARPPGSPANALMPLFPNESPRTPGPSGTGNAPPPSPVTLTLDSISADPEEKARARKEAREFFKLKVPARKVAPAVRKITSLKWHGTLAKAARDAAEQKKPILWIQALGDLKGFT